MKTLVIYGGQYGTTRRYAEAFAQQHQLLCAEEGTIRDLSEFDAVLHFGGLYAGEVKGLKHTQKALEPKTNLLVVTVGLADPDREENQQHIRANVDRQLPAERRGRTPMVHLRGSID